jgi:2-amino-4-hydroxy-6-hydroxymethyldihydropteridine diphosphokinase/dihydropteroate synthase
MEINSMVILGLGSNRGDRLTHLRHALRLIKKIPHLSVSQISPVYMSDALLPDNAPHAWDRFYLNLAVRCETTLTPSELLEKTKSIEKKFKSDNKEQWGPRAIDIDLLAWDNKIHLTPDLTIPHQHLPTRPFALWPLADVAPRWVYPLEGIWHGKTAAEMVMPWGSRLTGDAPLHTRRITQRIDMPALMGIINLTPDSFSKDTTVGAWQRIKHFIDIGADILDIGAEATGPNAIPITPDEEWKRLEPLLTQTIAEKTNLLIPPKISIDTRHASIAEKALALGVDWVNDVSGLEDSAMQRAVSKNACDLVFMHHLGIPANKNNCLPSHQDPVTFVYQWAEQRLSELEKKGITRDRLIFDPGIGYGKTADQSLEIIKNIAEFTKLGIRLLVGHSRKSFLASFTTQPPEKRDLETLVTSLYLANQNIDYLRVHDVETHQRGFCMSSALTL